jgi:HSP20 family protein
MKTTSLIPWLSTSELASFFDWPDKAIDRWRNSLYSTFKYPLDVSENENTITIEVPLAGYSKSDISVSMLNSIVSIKANKNKKDEEEKTFLVKRLKSEDLELSVDLFDLIEDDDSKINASFTDGLLKVSLQKKSKKTSTPTSKTIKID